VACPAFAANALNQGGGGGGGSEGGSGEEKGDGLTRFGKDENQVEHAFRHTDALGLDRTVVKSAIEKHFELVKSQILEGKPLSQIIEIAGKKIQYTAYKLTDGTINIGRIHGVP
jgi:hypothetical protein